MKIAPIINEMDNYNSNKPLEKYFNYLLVHTGQHYDENMSDYFFKDLQIPPPNIYLGVGSGSHAEQTAKIMIRFEKICLKEHPDLVIVVGDVNSTLACALVASKLLIPVAHIEAGLRSFDRTMPEEINRIITDSLSEYLFTTCLDANENLKNEGIPENKIYFVGNVMIDSLNKYEKISCSKIKKFNELKKDSYALLTLHRPSNVDTRRNFHRILEALNEISKKLPIIFPIHPRTKKMIERFGYSHLFHVTSDLRILSPRGIFLIPPLSYLEFLSLLCNSKFVLTDSGGIQEEATVLGIPCLTLRKNTERPITIKEGTNILVGTDKDKIIKETLNILNGKGKVGKIPKYWDGKASKRIINIFLEDFF
ncbi:MAG: non-hydrolyzing UDP-N-acetylglucosamine 2-epimerase [Candidatus Helarchaeota archaeon]